MKNYIWIACLMSFGFAQAQEQSTADEFYEARAYNKAAQLYENLLEKGFDSSDIHKRLADAYYFNSEYVESLQHYQTYVSNVEELESIYYLRLAKALEASGKASQAKVYYDKFLDTNSIDQIPTFSDYFNEIPTLELESSLKTNLSEYPTAVAHKSLYFISNRNTEKQDDQWTGEDLNTLFRKSLDNAYELEVVIPRLTSYHEGSVAIDEKGSTMYLTLGGKGNNFAIEGVQIEVLKIHKFIKKRKRWVHKGALPFNSDVFNTAHPSLSLDGSKMYFSSDRPGGYGSSDLYVVSIDDNGNFSEPKNLGPEVNTIGRESFPQVTPLDQLIFASDGHKGYGGFDLFGIDLAAKQPVLVNLGATYNSDQDDFSMIYCEPSHGFLGSNRAIDSSDDIYVFKHKKALDFTPNSSVIGRVLYKGEILEGVDLSLNQIQSDPVKNETNAEGQFKLNLDSYSSRSAMVVSKEGYDTKEITVPTKPFGVVDLGDIELQRSLDALKAGDNLAEYFDIEMIHFNFDKWDILPQSAEDLAKIAEVLLEYPQLKIEIRSHTDQIGTTSYNQVLSEKRAQSTLNYLLNLGVSSDQLTAKGYGKSQPLKDCNTCSIKERMVNRRSEFIVVQ